MPPAGLMGGNCFEENLSKTEGNRRIRPAFYTLFSSFDTSRGGDRRPQHASWRVGVSCKIFTEPLCRKNQTLILVPVLRLLLHERYGPTYVLTIFRSGAERLNNFKEEKYDDS